MKSIPLLNMGNIKFLGGDYYVNPTITMFTLEANLMGNQTVIHLSLIQEGDTAVLFDSGLPGVRAEMAKVGVSLEKLKVICHH